VSCRDQRDSSFVNSMGQVFSPALPRPNQSASQETIVMLHHCVTKNTNKRQEQGKEPRRLCDERSRDCFPCSLPGPLATHGPSLSSFDELTPPGRATHHQRRIRRRPLILCCRPAALSCVASSLPRPFIHFGKPARLPRPKDHVQCQEPPPAQCY
jgi:hypothetical protein